METNQFTNEASLVQVQKTNSTFSKQYQTFKKDTCNNIIFFHCNLSPPRQTKFLLLGLTKTFNSLFCYNIIFHFQGNVYCKNGKH